jgi:hypothetical protein
VFAGVGSFAIFLLKTLSSTFLPEILFRGDFLEKAGDHSE